MSAVDPQSFYLRIDEDVFESTAATASPWDATLQHGGPPSALLARGIERCSPRPDMLVAKISVDFLGALPQGRLTVEAAVLRPGRRIELVEASLLSADRPVAIARAWRIRAGTSPASAIAARLPMPMPLPPPQPQRYLAGIDPRWGYGRAIEWRPAEGGFESLGPARVWARPLLPLVHGGAAHRPPADTARHRLHQRDQCRAGSDGVAVRASIAHRDHAPAPRDGLAAAGRRDDDRRQRDRDDPGPDL